MQRGMRTRDMNSSRRNTRVSPEVPEDEHYTTDRDMRSSFSSVDEEIPLPGSISPNMNHHPPAAHHDLKGEWQSSSVTTYPLFVKPIPPFGQKGFHKHLNDRFIDFMPTCHLYIRIRPRGVSEEERSKGCKTPDILDLITTSSSGDSTKINPEMLLYEIYGTPAPDGWSATLEQIIVKSPFGPDVIQTGNHMIVIRNPAKEAVMRILFNKSGIIGSQTIKIESPPGVVLGWIQKRCWPRIVPLFRVYHSLDPSKPVFVMKGQAVDYLQSFLCSSKSRRNFVVYSYLSHNRNKSIVGHMYGEPSLDDYLESQQELSHQDFVGTNHGMHHLNHYPQPSPSVPTDITSLNSNHQNPCGSSLNVTKGHHPVPHPQKDNWSEVMGCSVPSDFSGPSKGLMLAALFAIHHHLIL